MNTIRGMSALFSLSWVLGCLGPVSASFADEPAPSASDARAENRCIHNFTAKFSLNAAVRVCQVPALRREISEVRKCFNRLINGVDQHGKQLADLYPRYPEEVALQICNADNIGSWTARVSCMDRARGVQYGHSVPPLAFGSTPEGAAFFCSGPYSYGADTPAPDAAALSCLYSLVNSHYSSAVAVRVCQPSNRDQIKQCFLDLTAQGVAATDEANAARLCLNNPSFRAPNLLGVNGCLGPRPTGQAVSTGTGPNVAPVAPSGAAIPNSSAAAGSSKGN